MTPPPTQMHHTEPGEFEHLQDLLQAEWIKAPHWGQDSFSPLHIDKGLFLKDKKLWIRQKAIIYLKHRQTGLGTSIGRKLCSGNLCFCSQSIVAAKQFESQWFVCHFSYCFHEWRTMTVKHTSCFILTTTITHHSCRESLEIVEALEPHSKRIHIRHLFLLRTYSWGDGLEKMLVCILIRRVNLRPVRQELSLPLSASLSLPPFLCFPLSFHPLTLSLSLSPPYLSLSLYLYLLLSVSEVPLRAAVGERGKRRVEFWRRVNFTLF